MNGVKNMNKPVFEISIPLLWSRLEFGWNSTYATLIGVEIQILIGVTVEAVVELEIRTFQRT